MADKVQYSIKINENKILFDEIIKEIQKNMENNSKLIPKIIEIYVAMVEEIKELKEKNAELQKVQNMVNFVLRMHNL